MSTLTPPFSLRERTPREFPWGQRRTALAVVQDSAGAWLLGTGNCYLPVRPEEVLPLVEFFSPLPHGAWQRYLRGESLEAIIEAAKERERAVPTIVLADDIELDL